MASRPSRESLPPIGRALALLVAVSLAGPWAAPAGASAQEETPPPTPVPPYGSPSPFPSTLATPEDPGESPQLSAPAGALFDLGSGRLLLEVGARERRPIASVTKVMTAMVVMDHAAPRDIVTVTSTMAAQSGAALGLRPGERIAIRDLLYALLLQSANDAAVALAEHVAGGVERFVAMMNRRARELGLEDTRFASPNGLDDAGYSTAADLAVITVHALRHPTIARAVATRFRSIPAPEGEERQVQNRNALLWLYPGAVGVKTGWTSAAGFCLVAAAERRGLRLGSVVLGAPQEAFSDAVALLDHGFARYEERAVVVAGQPFDPIVVGEREVPVEAGATLHALVREDGGVVVRIRPQPGLDLPIEAGQTVGRALVLAAGRDLGEVPLVAATDVPPDPSPALEPRALWWHRVAAALAALIGDFVLGSL